MKLKTTLFGNVYQFKDVKEVLAKANELRSGDVLAGGAAGRPPSLPLQPQAHRSAWRQSRCCRK